mgnify:CR=1 FL=1
MLEPAPGRNFSGPSVVPSRDGEDTRSRDEAAEAETKEGGWKMARDGNVRQVNIEVPTIMWAALDFWAAYTGKTKKEIIVQALSEYLEREGVDKYVRLKEVE